MFFTSDLVEILMFFSCRLMYIRTRKSGVADSSLCRFQSGRVGCVYVLKKVSFFRRYKICNYISSRGGHSISI